LLDYPLAVASRLRELRSERAKLSPGAFTAAAVAARIGVTESAYLRWERGESAPRQRHVRALAREFGVSEAELGLIKAE
jgi:transcriptional regulator with XRE-family HTH domain